MQSKSRRTLMALVGVYLIYNGVKLIIDVTKSNPNYKIVLILFGVIFVIFGAATVVLNARELLKEIKAEKNESSEEDILENEVETIQTSAGVDGGSFSLSEDSERVWKAPMVADEKVEDEVMLDEDADPLDEDADLLDEEPDFSELDEIE